MRSKIHQFYSGLILLTCMALCQFSAIAQTTPDPGLPGTYAVSKDEYNLGDLAFKPASFPDSVEVRGSVHYPTSLTGGPFPVLVFLHGRHETIFQTSNPSNSGLGWPPPPGWESITSYEGYDTLARLMASHGYIVISISANAINATDNSTGDYGMYGRGELIQHHLDLWNTWNTLGGGPFGSRFVGKLDLQNVGTMGHSRGGEGVVFNALLNRTLGSPYGIKAILTLAPVDFFRRVLNGIPLMNIAPYCDGDVSNIQGVHFYDDARYNDPSDTTPKYSVLMMGANHNFYNSVWTPGLYPAGTADDWNDYVGSTEAFCGTAGAGSKRLTPAKQEVSLISYAAAFYRQFLGHEMTFTAILQVEDIIPPVSSRLDTNQVFVSYHPALTKRLDLNRIDSTSRLVTNTLSDSVRQNGLLIGTICGGGLSMASCGISGGSGKEPHKGNSSTIGLAQMNMKWDNPTDYYQNNIPVAFQDLRNYKNIQFRAAVNFAEYLGGPDLNYSIQIADSFGNVASVRVSRYTKAMFFQPGSTGGLLPKIMFNTISIPLSDFTGINITKVKSVRFLYNQSAAGAILISDLTFTGATDQCGLVDSRYTHDTTGGYTVTFFDSSIIHAGDALAWGWNFGDPTSGATNTSAIQNPSHTFSGDGSFNACLYINALKTNGVNCKDTICSTVTIANQCAVLNVDYSADSVGFYDIAFNDSTTVNAGDIVSWRWNFGDPASGLANVSNLQNPVHTYPAAGNYTVCLTVQTHTNHGFVCRDSFCTTVTVHERIDHNGIDESTVSHIYIYPNPAKDYLDIRGAVSTDILELYDAFGQIVMTKTIAQPRIQLPETLASGMYFATITTSEGKIFKKILINR